jgi:hypothetical protein
MTLKIAFITLKKKERKLTYRPTFKNVGRSTSNKNISNNGLTIKTSILNVLQAIQSRAGYRGEKFDTIRIAIQETICDIY